MDKPEGWSSFDVVKKIRWAAPGRKAGHAGTLDPLASGLLIVCTGGQTKKIADFQSLSKVYHATLKMGCTTQSYDAETPEIPFGSGQSADLPTLQRAIQLFIGNIDQVPPLYSAVKIDGERAYTVARRGVHKELTARPVFIRSIRLIHFEAPYASLEVECGKGTYIRSLIHDLGQAAGCGAYMSSLRRTAIGPYHVHDAQSPEGICTYFKSHDSTKRAS